MNTILLALWLMQGSLGAVPHENDTLMILPFEAVSAEREYASLGNAIPDILMACLSPHSDAVQVVDRKHLDAMTQELGLVYEASMAEKSVVEIGRLAAARFIVTGSFWIKKDKIEIHIFTYETETTRLIGTTEMLVPIDAMESGCEPLVKTFSAQFKKVRNTPFVKPAPELHPEISQHMIHGLGFYYNGEFWRAFPAFLKVLEIDPNNANARFWLGRSYRSAGMDDLAIISLETFVRKFPRHEKWNEAKKLLKEVTHEK